MSIKVSELEGAQLDYWVARAEGENIAPAHPGPDPETGRYWLQMGKGYSVKECPRYSSDWAAGGPIIDRERIGTADDSPIGKNGTKWIAAIDLTASADGYGGASLDGLYHRPQRGPTLLVAAMRAYVASKFGEEVPDA